MCVKLKQRLLIKNMFLQKMYLHSVVRQRSTMVMTYTINKQKSLNKPSNKLSLLKK